ncbi:hypothetical protein PSE_5038 [Pseudovibrio sp. FO-BEG1]|nr:hypothetical protein PSE_5038 [Pseudovibrio sp. FO-BEG1]EEA92250.1 hypothetical protein PJE062_4070 [Pseudovibrio sp. JE062]
MRRLPFKTIQCAATDFCGTLAVTSILVGLLYLIFTLT